MVNINKIIIVFINLSDDGYLPSLDLFDYHLFFDDDKFVGLTLDNKSTRIVLDESGYNKVYNIDEFRFSTLPNTIINEMLDYIGFNYTTDGILDLLLLENTETRRCLYLKAILYYKSNQEGKPLLKFNLKVRDVDDLLHYYPEDIFTYKITNNNYDFSESDILIETCLIEDEVKNKFIDYLICFN